MGISFVNGQMLNSNLQRGTSNLAFQTNLFAIDVLNSRIGINTVNPASALEVVGNITIGNILIPNIGNINLGNVNINNLAEPFANSDAATKYYVDTMSGNVSNIGNLNISNTTITTTLTNGNITLTPTGTGEVIVASSLGFIIPVGNTTQRPVPATSGTIRYNTDANQLEVYNGLTSQWDPATNTTSVITNQTITGDGSTQTFTLNQNTNSEAILVSINGISQTPDVDYTVLVNQITFTTTPISGDIIQVRFIAAATTISGVTLPTYTTLQANNLTGVSVGQLIYVSDGANGSPCLATYSAGAWQRINLAGNISST